MEREGRAAKEMVDGVAVLGVEEVGMTSGSMVAVVVVVVAAADLRRSLRSSSQSRKEMG